MFHCNYPAIGDTELSWKLAGPSLELACGHISANSFPACNSPASVVSEYTCKLVLFFENLA